MKIQLSFLMPDPDTDLTLSFTHVVKSYFFFHSRSVEMDTDPDPARQTLDADPRSGSAKLMRILPDPQHLHYIFCISGGGFIAGLPGPGGLWADHLRDSLLPPRQYQSRLQVSTLVPYLKQGKPHKVFRMKMGFILVFWIWIRIHQDPHSFGCLGSGSRSMEIYQNLQINLVFCLSERLLSLYVCFLTYYICIFFM